MCWALRILSGLGRRVRSCQPAASLSCRRGIRSAAPACNCTRRTLSRRACWRAQEIERLERQARAQRARVDAASTRAAEAEAAQQAARRTLADLSAQYEKAVARAHALQLETQQCAQAHQSAAKRRAHLDEELLELDAHISAQRARIDEYAAHLEQADGQLAQLKKRSDEAK